MTKLRHLATMLPFTATAQLSVMYILAMTPWSERAALSCMIFLLAKFGQDIRLIISRIKIISIYKGVLFYTRLNFSNNIYNDN